ncbi:MAG: DNA polymerase II large subunit [Candidatus Diapherotrites archaeon]
MKHIVASPDIQKYFSNLEKKALEQVEIASKARAKGFDASTSIETQPVTDLADRAETIIGPKGIAKRYRELMAKAEGENKRIKTIFTLFEEIIQQKWCSIPDDSKRIEQAIKTALVLNTEGVVVAPIDGVPKVEISKNPDGSQYVDIYYAGPIRAAGGTSQVLPLILGDYARKLMGLDRYRPTKDEVERYVEETQIYEGIVSRQYRITEEEVRKIVEGCPVCINGEPTEEREVSVHRDLPRIPHNRVRGGMCLVISEGIALKARKILKFAELLGLDWSWLEQIIKHGKEKGESLEPKDKYLEGIAAGRPIFAYPSRFGGFRLRYGRTRAMGIMCKAIHPATMKILDDFIAIGTQVKVERPGKAGSISAVDSIEGPIVLLKDGEVRQLHSAKEAEEIMPKLEKILFLGDLLVAYGDFRYSAHRLLPAGYNEEWWALELREASKDKKIEGIDLEKTIREPRSLDCHSALKISMELGIPLHPAFTQYYSALTTEETLFLVKECAKAEKKIEGKKITGAFLDLKEKTKALLEKIGLEHSLQEKKIIVGERQAEAFLTVFGALNEKKPVLEGEDALSILRKASGLRLRDKAGSFIGVRMGRPEASSPRKMKGNPHVLFPIGNYGGSTRSINKAMIVSEQSGGIEIEVGNFKCKECNSVVPFAFCPYCGNRTEKTNACQECGTIIKTEKCPKCGSMAKAFGKRKERIDLLVKKEAERMGIKVPDLVKGVRGMINAEKTAEPLGKGLLRARHDLHIFRDGTIRYELINNPLTHFKPAETSTSIEKLRELGYEKDIYGKPLTEKNQVLELHPQDLIIHEAAGDFFVKVSAFLDEELEKFYGLKRHFNAKNRQDLIGELVLGLAPHTSAAIIGRIIGFTKARACFAHPYFHQTKRRNADGDQDSIMLLLDGLLNFSQSYLPSSRGGRMDAPLVFTVALIPEEIDTEVYEMETCNEYPLELYLKALEFAPPEIKGVDIVQDRLGTERQYSGFGFTHETQDFADGPTVSKYVQLQSMEEKIMAQARLQSKIAAVDLKDSLERLIASHFMPDIIGNTRAFGRQEFRCTNCNAKYRRIPLSGKCSKCEKGNIILTIAPGSVTKYLEIAKKIVKEYGLSDYLGQRLALIEEEINSVFRNDAVSQKSLGDFA